MRQPDVVRGEVPSMGPESWVVVRRRGQIGTRRPRIEVPAAPEAVALRHLATHVDDLAVPGELQEDSANSEGLKLLNSCLSGGSRCRSRHPWGSCLMRPLLVGHSRLISSRRWRRTPLRRRPPTGGRLIGGSIPFASPVGLPSPARSAQSDAAANTPTTGAWSLRPPTVQSSTLHVHIDCASPRLTRRWSF
jgi:hypothetical protein